jgi:Cof subfamily protein (haloacid dehalogenase superfamily)
MTTETTPAPAAGTRISALISDVDGTLVTKAKVLTERASEAVAQLKSRGIAFTIVSSRPPRGLQSLIGPLGLVHAVAGFNGGVIVRPDMSVLTQHTIAPDVAREAVDLIKARGADIWVFARGEWFLTNPTGAHVDTELRAVQFGPTLVTDFGDILGEAHKIVGVSNDHAMLERAETEMENHLGTRATVVRSQLYYLDVTHPLANKGDAVVALAASMAVPMDEVAVIGDGSNDVAMFKKSRVSIAMGNGSPYVQGSATYVTDTNEDDGFAKAVERYVLQLI